MSELFERQLIRAKRKVSLLEQMIEDKTRELYLEHSASERSNQFLNKILRSMPSGVIVTDPNFVVIMVNQAISSLLKKSESEILGCSFLEVLPVRGLTNTIIDQRHELLPSEQAEDLLIRPGDQANIPITYSFSIIRAPDQSIEALVCLVSDLTEKKALERQLLQSQKLESVGQLAAGIAHEINTPIQYVRDNTVFVRDEFRSLRLLLQDLRSCIDDSSTPQAHDRCQKIAARMAGLDLEYLLEEIPLALEQAFEGAESVARIVRSMKSFSHPGSTDKVLTSLNDAIENTVTVSRNEWKYVAEIELNLDPKLPMIECYPGELNQVFLNLIINAAHAITERSSSYSSGKGLIRISSGFFNGQVVITISDNGNGIPEENRSRIFDPFFTTKPVGHGTGQGLSMAHATITERHSGEILFESKTGLGTSFEIRLPLESDHSNFQTD
ncbi:MAG: PAS domain-containing protein [Bdellovibrionales bacterium]|nr:PAS domain-containing protein [Bdellovibrionales bacterium]